jgi:hypothetical protein
MPKLRHRGAGAWERVAHAGLPPGRAEGGVNLLHVHAVQDGTNAQAYIPAVRAFLVEARTRGWSLGTVEQRDRALADMLAILCYVREAGVQSGRNLMAGFQHVYPEHADRLPEAARAMQAWERLGTSGEGAPICAEAWGALVLAFLRSGDDEGALITALKFDCLLRGQDWEHLRVADVCGSEAADGSLEVALLLGVRERGESVKTGSNQGVVIDRAWVAQWLLEFKAQRERAGATFLFTLSRDEFGSRFHLQQRRLQIDVGPPHRLRHGGAATLIAAGGLPVVTAVKLRGRWESDKSLRRYTKMHILAAQRASLPPAVLRLGRLFLADPPNEIKRARLNVIEPRP